MAHGGPPKVMKTRQAGHIVSIIWTASSTERYAKPTLTGIDFRQPAAGHIVVPVDRTGCLAVQVRPIAHESNEVSHSRRRYYRSFTVGAQPNDDSAMIVTMPPRPAEDTALFEALRRRDPQAMAKLYDAFGQVVYSVIYRIVHDTGVAEDLAQETFLRVWNQAQAFDASRGSAAAWVLAVARNRAIDWLRSAAGKASNLWDSYDTERPGNFVDMEQVLIHSDQARRVREAMARLNENQRSVIELAYFEGLSQSAMAERMGQPLGTVKTWVRAALKCLREELSSAS